jgi:hypothetical protein
MPSFPPQVEQAARLFMASTCEMLASSRQEVWDAVGWRIKELLSSIPFKGEDFLQVRKAARRTGQLSAGAQYVASCGSTELHYFLLSNGRT